MSLKQRYEKREEIPPNLAAHYTERDGAFHLEADRDPELEEFRTNNLALLKENRELKERFAGIDPAAHKALAAEKARLEEEQRLKDGKFQEVLADRLKAAVSPVAAERDALHARLTAIQIDQAVVTEATKRGLRPSAIADITARARSAFKLVNGVPQAFDGETVRTGKDGVSPMTLAEWVDGLVGDAPHLFEANAGGGATGSGSGGAGNRSVKNPFRQETWNLTEQMKLERTDPQLAARLKTAAGTGA